MSDAWDIQADLEMAAVEGEHCAGALLDYEKFFDLFDPELARLLLARAGIPNRLATQLCSLYSGLIRYMKVAGTFGAVIKQENGCPQGCSFSLFVANLYVTTLFNFVQHKYPDVSLGAFIDDRNLRTHDLDTLQKALTDICRFDSAAGHKTNIDKSAVFATDTKLRKKVSNIVVEGKKARCSLHETMVGHTINTKRSQNSTTGIMNQRMEETIRRADKISRADIPPSLKRKLIETAALPTSWCGCMWSLPTTKLQTKAANTVVAALWGQKRQMRCREIVLSVLHDPAKVDPASSLVFKRLHDARRTLRRSEERLNRAIHTNEMLEHHEGKTIVGPVHGIRTAANALAGTVRIREGDLAIVFEDDEPPIFMTKYSDKMWKWAVKERIKKVIATALDKRTVRPDSTREDGGRTRKDLFGIGTRIDHSATTSLTRGKLQSLPECVQGINLPDDPHRYHKDPIWKQRASAIIAGSVRAFDRLHAAGLCDGKQCQLCGAISGTTEHIIWDCPVFSQTRAPFLDAIHAYTEHVRKRDNARAEWITDLMSKPCVRCCGVIPDDPFLYSEQNAPRKDQGNWCITNPRDGDIEEEVRQTQKYRNNRLLVYVDGSAFNPTDPRRTRAGWAIYLADNHPSNAYGHLPGAAQNSFRAELAAALHAITVIKEPLHIVSDCRGVVDGIKGMILGDPPPRGDDADLWNSIHRILDSNGRDGYDITWVKSHVTEKQAKEIDAAGGFDYDDIMANGKVDDLAKRGAGTHGANHQHFLAADDREIIANLVQRLQTTVWAEYFAMYEDDWDQEGESDPNPAVRTNEPASNSAPQDTHHHHRPQQQVEHQGCDEDHDESYIDADWTIERIATALKAKVPNFGWEVNPEELCCTIKFPEPASPFDHTPGTYTVVRGRGKIATGIDCSPILIEALKWWVRGVKWTVHWSEKPEHRQTHEYTTSFLEMVVDVEAATGIDVPAKTWHDKAIKLAALLRNIARVYTVQIDGVAGSWKKAADPRADYPSLTPLGAPRTSGVARRPRWMCQSTPAVVAANIWRNLEHHRKEHGTTDTQHITRTFLKGHQVDRTGIKQVIVWSTRAEKEAKLKFEDAMKHYYEAREKWQSNPKGPPPQPPSKRSLDELAMRLKSMETRTARASTSTSASTSTPTSSSPPSATIDISQGSPLPRAPPPASGLGGLDRDPLEVADKSECSTSPTPAASSSCVTPLPSSPRVTRCAREALHHVGTASGRAAAKPLRGPTDDSVNQLREGSSAASSCGSSSVPFIATSLRELREHFALDSHLAPVQDFETRHLGSMPGNNEHASGKRHDRNPD